MKKLFLSAAALVVLFAACSKDDDKNAPDNPDKTETVPKLHQSTVSATDSFQSVYDVDYKLIKTVFWSPKNTQRQTDSMVYENGRLTRIMSGRGGVFNLWLTHGYNSANKLEIAAYYFTDGTMSSYDSIIYNAEGRPAAAFGKEPDARPRYKKVYTWNSMGNLAREIRISYSNGVESKDTGIVDFTYDDKVNYGSKQPESFLQQPDLVAFGFSVNNAVKSLSWNTANPGTVSQITREYTYDNDGYPASRKDVARSIVNGQEGPVTYQKEFRFYYTR